MITAVTFENFRVLTKTTLFLEPFTLIVGPNGSGKSTALDAILALRNCSGMHGLDCISITQPTLTCRLMIACVLQSHQLQCNLTWGRNTVGSLEIRGAGGGVNEQLSLGLVNTFAGRIRRYSFDAHRLTEPMQLTPDAEFDEAGGRLAIVLDRLRDEHPERFEALNSELARCMPEFDQILFRTPGVGLREMALRTRQSQQMIRAASLSQGTLLAVALLTLAYLPNPPSVICLEEPERGIHPRLLGRVRDTLYRLTYPKAFGENRVPVQVVATTHAPYFLDLFRERPKEVVIASKSGESGVFQRLADLPNFEAILAGARLSDAWYTGALGGVPAES